MSNKSRVIQFWGICDFLFIAWWVSRALIRKEIPIYSDITRALSTSSSFGSYWPLYGSIMVLVLYASFIYSGKLLIQSNPKAALIAYIQTPFRFITATPSLFFATWPITYFFVGHKQILIAGYAIILISEAAKIATIAPWHMKIKENL